jgi:hypothetical protein
LIYEEILPNNSFMLDNDHYDVPCVFQIWRRDKSNRRETIKTVTKHADFEFATKQNADFAIQRVGVGAGSIKSNFSKCASESHHFIKSSVDNVETFMREIDWDSVKFNTAGNPSISKHEIIALYVKTRYAD